MTQKTTAELAALCGATLEGDGAHAIDGPASLEEATPREITFFAHAKYRKHLLTTRAGAVLVGAEVEVPRRDLVVLRCKDASAAFTRIVRAFAPAEPRAPVGTHPSAVVDPSASIGAGASIGPQCSVGAGAQIGAGVVLHANVTVGDRAAVGEHSVLHPSVVLYPGVSVGARCIVHAGAVIGSDGYGFEPSASGWSKIPQYGTVIVGDDVEIGANTTIDRARFGATRIGRGAKLDNLVHIAHNVIVGEAALIIAQTGIAGSSRVGPRVILGGQVGVNGHVEIGAGARVAAQSGVFGDVPAGAEYLGFPARDRKDALRQLAAAQKLPELLERLKRLERRLGAVEKESP